MVASQRNHLSGLFVMGEDAETNALLWWRGNERWVAYADGYKKAADILVERVIQAASDQDFLVYPICFHYRQYLELRLKGMIAVGHQLRGTRGQLPNHHDIAKLWKQARAVLEGVWPEEPKSDLDNTEAYIHQFVEVDPRSEAFRYPFYKDGKETLSGLAGINLRNLLEIMGKLADLLDSALDGLNQMVRIKREAEDYLVGIE